MLYAIGLTSYSCVKIYVPTFYALNDTRSPVRVSIITAVIHVLSNLLLVFVLFPEGYEFLGLALATSFSLLVNHTLLVRKLTKQLGSFRDLGVGRVVQKAVLASLIMATCVYMLSSWLSLWEREGVERLLVLGLSIGVGGIVYLLAALALRLEEVRILLSIGGDTAK